MHMPQKYRIYKLALIHLSLLNFQVELEVGLVPVYLAEVQIKSSVFKFKTQSLSLLQILFFNSLLRGPYVQIVVS